MERVMNIHEKALQLTVSERYAEAIPYIKQTLKLIPKSAEMHASLAMCYMNCSQLTKAENAISKSIKLNPSNAIAKLIRADIAKRKGLLKSSEHNIKEALRLSPDNASVLAFYANLLIEKGDMKGAAKYADKAEEVDPEKGLECAILASNFLKATKDSKHFKKLQDEFNEDLPQKNLIPAAFALGKCFDEVGEYDKAFKYYEIGNTHKAAQLILNKTPSDPEAHSAYVKSIIKLMPDYLVSSNTGKGNNSQEPIFIVGMPRSGTTLVESIITAGDVVAGGELPHFSTIAHTFNYPDTDNEFNSFDFAKLGKQYLDRTGLRGARFTDKLPNNFHFLGFIRLCFPNAKVIHVKRNPYDTCLSMYFNNFTSLNYTNNLEHLGVYYNDYMDLMEHWRGCVDFYEIQYETLIEHQEEETRNLINYCGLEWNDCYMEPHKNNRRVSTASMQQVREPVYKTSKHKHKKYEKHLDSLIETIMV